MRTTTAQPARGVTRVAALLTAALLAGGLTGGSLATTGSASAANASTTPDVFWCQPMAGPGFVEITVMPDESTVSLNIASAVTTCGVNVSGDTPQTNNLPTNPDKGTWVALPGGTWTSSASTLPQMPVRWIDSSGAVVGTTIVTTNVLRAPTQRIDHTISCSFKPGQPLFLDGMSVDGDRQFGGSWRLVSAPSAGSWVLATGLGEVGKSLAWQAPSTAVPAGSSTTYQFAVESAANWFNTDTGPDRWGTTTVTVSVRSDVTQAYPWATCDAAA